MDELDWVGEDLPLPAPRSRLIRALKARPLVWLRAPSQNTAYANQTYRKHGVEQAMRNGVRYLRYSPGLERFFSDPESQSIVSEGRPNHDELRDGGEIRQRDVQ